MTPRVGMGAERRCDKRGRITIPAELRERYGERFRVVELADGIKLVPIPEDPIATLREAGSDEFRSASLSELEAAASTPPDGDEDVR